MTKKKSENYYIIKVFGYVTGAITLGLLYAKIQHDFGHWVLIMAAGVITSYFLSTAEERK